MQATVVEDAGVRRLPVESECTEGCLFCYSSGESSGALTEVAVHEHTDEPTLPVTQGGKEEVHDHLHCHHEEEQQQQQQQEKHCRVEEGETDSFVILKPVLRGVNEWILNSDGEFRWCRCGEKGSGGGTSASAVGCSRLEKSPSAGICPLAVLQGLLHKPVRLCLHKHSAGGTYMVLHPDSASKSGGQIMAVLKPRDEEIGQPGNPHGNCVSERIGEFTPGTGCIREILAYLLDHEGSAGVMPTLEVCATAPEPVSDIEHKCNDVRTGSLQYFVPGCVEAADLLPGTFAVDEVHRIAIFDICTLNCDRHGGNVLVRCAGAANSARSCSHNDKDQVDGPHLIPIDHSYICPSGFADPEFEWLSWPQAKVAYSESSLAYIARLDAARNATLVRGVLLETMANDKAGADAAAEVVQCTTRLLQISALQYGLSAHDIGQLCRRRTLATPSVLEELMEESRDEFWHVHLSTFQDMLHRRLQQKM